VVTAVVHDVLAQLAATRPDPRAQARTQVLAAATATPGATRRQILVEAGYGRANPTALQALEDLVATGELHLRSTPSRAGGSHLGVHPGPASQDAQPTALPGEELRRGRLAVSLKQHELAALVGVTQTAVGQWERSTVPAYRTGDVLKALATASIPEIMALPAITAQQLRRARQEAGISQEALGEALGVTGPAVSRWERVGVPRNRETAVNLALSGAPARAQRTFPRTRGASGARAQHTV
jgi:transcriptional regulator with XRE-family HTH domain